MTTEAEDRKLIAQRGGDNEPLHLKRARHDGLRSVRVQVGKKEIGLATATYSYALTHGERCAVARRMAALWNFGAQHGLSTEALEAAVKP